MHVSLQVYVCVWRPEINVVDLSQYLLHLIIVLVIIIIISIINLTHVSNRIAHELAKLTGQHAPGILLFLLLEL